MLNPIYVVYISTGALDPFLYRFAVTSIRSRFAWRLGVCMVILLNLENLLYESLYGVLNQCYMYYGGVRYVDLGLQTHRVNCRVHPNFK